MFLGGFSTARKSNRAQGRNAFQESQLHRRASCQFEVLAEGGR